MRLVTIITSYRTELHNIINVSIQVSFFGVMADMIVRLTSPDNIDKIVNRI